MPIPDGTNSNQSVTTRESICSSLFGVQANLIGVPEANWKSPAKIGQLPKASAIYTLFGTAFNSKFGGFTTRRPARPRQSWFRRKMPVRTQLQRGDLADQRIVVGVILLAFTLINPSAESA